MNNEITMATIQGDAHLCKTLIDCIETSRSKGRDPEHILDYLLNILVLRRKECDKELSRLLNENYQDIIDGSDMLHRKYGYTPIETDDWEYDLECDNNE